jgi:cysteine-rich repeat protein
MRRLQPKKATPRRRMASGLLVGALLLIGSGHAAAGVLPTPCADVASTAPCDDGDACTQADHCRGGACVGSAPFWVATHARVGNGSALAGDLTVNAAGGQLAIGRRTEAAHGVRVTGDGVRLGVGASLFDVAANTLNPGATRATIAGTLITPITVPVHTPFCAIPPIACGGPDVTLAPGSVQELLAPQSYGALRVGRGATLTLAPGSFAFCDVVIARDAAVRALGAGPTHVEVAARLALGPRAVLGPGAGGAMPTVRVDGSHVRLGRGAQLEALLAAPAARVHLGSEAEINGTLCAHSLAAGRATTLTCALTCGDEVLAPGEGCDDGNTANDDGCSAACLVECNGSVCAPGEICLGNSCFGGLP